MGRVIAAEYYSNSYTCNHDPRTEGGEMPVQVFHCIEERHIDVRSDKQREILIQFELYSGREFERKLERCCMRKRTCSKGYFPCARAFSQNQCPYYNRALQDKVFPPFRYNVALSKISAESPA